LEQRSLVVTEEVAATTSMHFRMLETVREFAAEQLSATDAHGGQLLRQQHADFFASLAEEGEKQFHGPDAVTWLDRLESDHDNFRAALEWVLANPEFIDFGLRIAAGLHRFWYIRGYLSEGRRWLQKVLNTSGTGEPTVVRANALSAAAGLAGAEGEITAAHSLHAEALTTQRICNDVRGISYSLCYLGLVASGQNDHDRAHEYYQESLKIAREIRDEGNEAHVLKCLGANAMMRGDTDLAEQLFEESLAMYRRFGDRRGIAMVLGELSGLVLYHKKDYAKAEAYLGENLKLARQINDVVHTAHALSGLGQLAQARGDYSQAKAYLDEGLNLFRTRGYEWEVLPLLTCFANLSVAQQEHGRAVRIEAAADALSRRLNPALPDSDQECEKPSLAELRSALGSAAFETAWAEGAAMSLDQVIHYTIEAS
ncbi:MAG: tetratricopeptide repeat protein, partial [Armatimonadota bacterium]